jgi:nucleoside 2-deoxyribosyltransferase
MQIYLSGAIEYAPDHGKAWRAEIAPFLRQLGHNVYDPAQDEKKNLTDEEMRNFRAWKRADLDRFRATVRKIIAWDLDWVERRADCVIAYWDEYAPRGAGSQAEVSLAYRRGIPVYLVAVMPVEQISGWILGCATHVFSSFDELKSHWAAQPSTAMAQSS